MFTPKVSFEVSGENLDMYQFLRMRREIGGVAATGGLRVEIVGADQIPQPELTHDKLGLVRADFDRVGELRNVPGMFSTKVWGAVSIGALEWLEEPFGFHDRIREGREGRQHLADDIRTSNRMAPGYRLFSSQAIVIPRTFAEEVALTSGMPGGIEPPKLGEKGIDFLITVLSSLRPEDS